MLLFRKIPDFQNRKSATLDEHNKRSGDICKDLIDFWRVNR